MYPLYVIKLPPTGAQADPSLVCNLIQIFPQPAGQLPPQQLPGNTAVQGVVLLHQHPLGSWVQLENQLLREFSLQHVSTQQKWWEALCKLGRFLGIWQKSMVYKGRKNRTL